MLTLDELHKLYNTESLVLSLRQNAYAIVEGAVNDLKRDLIFTETSSQKVRVNPNSLGSVFHGATQFFTNIIANSKIVHDIILSPLVLDICREYLGGNYQLVNNRIQTTRGKMAMPWHTDNNLLDNGKLIGRHSMPGLQFVLYLTDVSASPFQLIKDSHKWSINHKKQYLTDEDIKELDLEVIELRPKPGSLLILNTHLFHRAAPLSDSENVRSILLFQVDRISPEYPEHGEKLLLNSEFLADVNPEITKFLGFGRKRSNPPFPESSLATLGPSKITSLQLTLLKASPKVIAKNILKKIIPQFFFITLKNAVVANRTNAPKDNDNMSSNPYLDN